MTLSEVVLICGKLFSMIKKFLAIFNTQVLTYIITGTFTYIFSKRQKSIAFDLLVELNIPSFFVFYS